jgi:hypothetical protein
LIYFGGWVQGYENKNSLSDKRGGVCQEMRRISCQPS